MKRPEHCKGCVCWHGAGHKQGTQYHGTKYDNWCTQFSKAAPRAVGHCKNTGGKRERAK